MSREFGEKEFEELKSHMAVMAAQVAEADDMLWKLVGQVGAKVIAETDTAEKERLNSLHLRLHRMSGKLNAASALMLSAVRAGEADYTTLFEEEPK